MQQEQEARGDLNEMKQTKANWARVVAAGVLAGFGFSAEAALVVPAGNSLVVNDTDFKITWTQDANLFKTQASSYAGGASAFVTAVIGAVGGVIGDTPNVYDTPANSGNYNLTVSDFNTSTGQMTWWGAQAWVGYLNSISYGGVTGWRLPTAQNQDATGPCSNYNCTGSELGHLFYSELGGATGQSITTTHNASYDLFSNVQSSTYWSSTEYVTHPFLAWIFFTDSGSQGSTNKTQPMYGWAVRDGQVGTVPVPASVWLMGSGLVGLVGWGRKARTG